MFGRDEKFSRMTVLCGTCTDELCCHPTLWAAQGWCPLTSIIASFLEFAFPPWTQEVTFVPNFATEKLGPLVPEDWGRNIAKPCMTLLHATLGAIPGDQIRVSLFPVLRAMSPSLVSHSKMGSLWPSFPSLSCFNVLLNTFSVWPTSIALYFVIRLLFVS